MDRSAPALRIEWQDGRLVGRLVVPGATFFGYDEAWLADGYNLSPLAVPFSPVVFRQRHDGFDQLPGFLSDCLPDQWGRRLMEPDFRALDVSPTPMRMFAPTRRAEAGAEPSSPLVSLQSVIHLYP